MKLNKSHIRILNLLTFKDYSSVSSIQKDLALSLSRIDVCLQALEKLKLVEMRRLGKNVQVQLAVTKHAQVYKKILTKNPHMKLESILTGQKIRIITLLLKRPGTILTLAEKLKLSTRTIQRNTSTLMEFGIITCKKGFFAPNQQRGDIFRFIEEILSYSNLKISRAIVQGTIVWEYLDEFIIESPTKIDLKNFKLTGYRALSGYGLPLITGRGWHYYYTQDSEDLRLEDICLHILTISTQLSRDIIYITIIILQNKDYWRWTYIEREARLFKLNALIQTLKKYILTKGEKAPKEFPVWAEVIETANGYDIYV